uniref:Oligopeptide transporter 1 n=1 Tax=Syphacia muris TaxID=451379 RepID=A0A0N5AQP9_9BILA
MTDNDLFDSGLTKSKQQISDDDRTTNSSTDLESSHISELDPEPTTFKGIIKRWPKSTFCIIGNEFCERFSYTGMRTVLTLYVMNILSFSDDDATILFHSFIVLSYVSPLLGSILADGYIGKFWTIFWISILYAAGNVTLAIASTFSKGSGVHPYLDIAGLIIIGFGTGGIKPCVCAFGGDQFNPSHLRMISMFFSVFYFTVNVGSTLSTLITPELRTIPCNGADSCYPLAFGIPAGLMALATISFMSGSVYYKKYPPKENVMSRVVFAIGVSRFLIAEKALKNKWSSKVHRDHWLEHYLDNHVCAEDPRCLELRNSIEYDGKSCAQEKFVEEIKSLIRVTIVLMPVPMFWALYDQQGTRWIIQAVEMDSRVGNSFTLLPDQMITFNAVMVILFIPIFQAFIYPFFEKIGIRTTPLRRLVVGGFLAAGAFVICGIVQLNVNKTLPDVPSSNVAFVSFINTHPDCGIIVRGEGIDERNVAASTSLTDDKIIDVKELYRIEVGESSTFKFNIEFSHGCSGKNSTEFSPLLKGGKSYYVIVSPQGISYDETIWDKPTEGNGQSSLNINFLLPCNMVPKTVSWATCDEMNTYSDKMALCPVYTNSAHPCNPKSKHYYSWTKDDIVTQDVYSDDNLIVLHAQTYGFVNPRPGDYQLYYINYNSSDSDYTPKAEEVTAIPVENGILKIEGMGGVYNYVIDVVDPVSKPITQVNYHTVTPKNHLNILLQVPQYAVLTASEVLFSITGLEFAYSQAAANMKSVVQALWLLTVGIGDIIIIIIAKLDLFDNLAIEMFVYAGAMAVIIGIFTLLAIFYYEYTDFNTESKLRPDSSSADDTSLKKETL